MKKQGGMKDGMKQEQERRKQNRKCGLNDLAEKFNPYSFSKQDQLIPKILFSKTGKVEKILKGILD